MLVAPFARWDSVWYLAIADSGYGDGAREAFFPLYPIVAGLAGRPFGSALVGGVLASTALLGVALVLLHRLVALDHDRAVARNAVLVDRARPDVVLLLGGLQRVAVPRAVGRGGLRGAAGQLGAGGRARRPGCADAQRGRACCSSRCSILYLWDTRSLRSRPGASRLDVLWLGLVPCGLAAYCVYLGLSGGDALAPFHAQEVWFRSFAGPVRRGVGRGRRGRGRARASSRPARATPCTSRAAGGDPFIVARHNLELLVWLGLTVAALIGALRRLPAAYGAYVVAALALPLSYPVAPQPLMSLPRFVAVLFPLAIWLAVWMTGRVWRERLVLGTFAAGLAVYTAIFATWHWVA